MAVSPQSDKSLSHNFEPLFKSIEHETDLTERQNCVFQTEVTCKSYIGKCTPTLGIPMNASVG